MLLIDHANCEKKPASTALGLMYRHTTHELLQKLSRLAREELRHFGAGRCHHEKTRHRVQDHHRVALRGQFVHACVPKRDPEKLADTLILGAII
ncbi:MAG: tRNA isopentenyl-2-thiomethyl-A-37 hydroxylase MiaE [Pseudomonadales bacterium]